MEKPLHKLCGTRHWSNERCPLKAKNSTTTTKAKSPSRPKSVPKSSSGSEPSVVRPGSPSRPTAATSAAGGTLGTDLNEASLTEMLVKVRTMPGATIKPTRAVLKVDRKTYLKLKARERRKRERKAADALGITVAEYRYRRSKGEFK